MAPTAPQYDPAIKAFLKEPNVSSLPVKKAMLRTVLDELATKKTYSVEFTQKDDAGILRSKQLRFSYIDEDAKIILFTVNDFTDVVDQERTQQELLQMALNAAKQAGAAKSEFLSRMSHDMGTPMNGIIGLTSLAMDLPDLTPEVLEHLSGIKGSSQYLLSLINDVLDMSKIESNKLVLMPQPINARRLVDDIINSMRTQLDEKRSPWICSCSIRSLVMCWLTGSGCSKFSQTFCQMPLNSPPSAKKLNGLSNARNGWIGSKQCNSWVGLLSCIN